MDTPAHRRHLMVGVRSGYLFSFIWPTLAWLATLAGVMPHQPLIYALVGAKLVTNVLADVGLRRDWYALELGGLNIAADMLLLTGGIHLTGGPLSPLFVAYVIEICVLALLTNRGVTVLLASFAFVCHAGATLLTAAGVLTQYPPPAATVVPLDAAQITLALGFSAFVLGSTTVFTTTLANELGDKRRALEKRTQELLEAGQQKSHFMANVTHELRTPLHGIGGLVELLDAEIYGPVTAEQREAHESIRESSQSLLGMVDDLLTLSRADAARLERKVAPFDVDELVERVVASVRWMMGKKRLSLSIELAPQLVLASDRGRIAQILVNLLANAVKFTDEGGKVTLRAHPGTDGAVFEVIDTGIGIPELELPRIFEPFRQVEGGDERTFGGVGLGLSLVRRLVELLDGVLEVESLVGEGSTFRVILPALPWAEAPDDVSGARRVA
ncbi:MAG: HAMP domain-containing histidine kinase [Sandaracinus sp.]|nr:HAMP domain-containing histidine kinase [Sandaracinus sp.]